MIWSQGRGQFKGKGGSQKRDNASLNLLFPQRIGSVLGGAAAGGGRRDRSFLGLDLIRAIHRGLQQNPLLMFNCQ